MSHTQAEMTVYKEAPLGTTAEVADGTSLTVDGYGTVELDLNQPDTTAKPVKMISVAYVPGLSWNLLSTRNVVEQSDKPLVYYKTKAVLGSRGRSRFF